MLFLPTPQLRFKFLHLMVLLLSTLWLRTRRCKKLSPSPPQFGHQKSGKPSAPDNLTSWSSYLQDFIEDRRGSEKGTHKQWLQCMQQDDVGEHSGGTEGRWLTSERLPTGGDT